MSKYTATAKNLAGLLPDEDETELSREIEKAIVDAVMAERGACALILARSVADRLVVCPTEDSAFPVFQRQAALLIDAANAILARGDI